MRPMSKKLTIAASLLLTAAGIFDNRACAQSVILSEISTSGTDRWIELQNRTNGSVDISAWSIYLATNTPNRPQTYWWGFPAGTVLSAGSFLRVHWYQAAPGTTSPGEIWTGNTIYQFLFGLGAEPLPTTAGAIALLRTQANTYMNNPVVFADFVQYGAAGLNREALAVQNGVWTAGAALPAPSSSQSLARNPALIGLAAPQAQWLLDDTPTPGSSNIGAASVAAIGSPCAVLGNHLLGAPELRATSTPLMGNSSFALQVTNTSGVMLEHCMVAFSLGVLPAGNAFLLPQVPGGGCSLFIDPTMALGTMWVHTGTMTTDIPLPLPAAPMTLQGLTFSAQAIVFDLWQSAYPAYQGATNAVAITIGN